jgi:LAO/AO transport system kinase
MWDPPIIKTIATESKGIEDLAAAISSYSEYQQNTGENGDERKRLIARWRLMELLRERLLADLIGRNGTGQKIEEMAVAVATKQKDPYTAVEEIIGNK